MCEFLLIRSLDSNRTYSYFRKIKVIGNVSNIVFNTFSADLFGEGEEVLEKAGEFFVFNCTARILKMSEIKKSLVKK